MTAYPCANSPTANVSQPHPQRINGYAIMGFARSCLLAILAAALPGGVDGQCGEPYDYLPTAIGAPGAFTCSSCWGGGGMSSWLRACSASSPCVGGGNIGSNSECNANADRINALTTEAGRATNFHCNCPTCVSGEDSVSILIPASRLLCRDSRRGILDLARISPPCRRPSLPLAQSPRPLQ